MYHFEISDELFADKDSYCVGDIVIVKHLNIKGFIEEILVDPKGKINSPDMIYSKSGKFSIFGLQKGKNGNWDLGNFMGIQLDHTGTKMSKADLRDYQFKNKFEDIQLEKTIDVVLRNYGRSEGHNV